MLPTNIGSITLTNVLYNASGVHCTLKSELEELSHSSVGAVVSKSCTLSYRKGNAHPRYYENSLCSINSTGLANQGYDYYGNIHLGKPYFVSVCGLSLDNNLKIVDHINQCSNVDGIELNLSCPNIIGKSLVGYDMDATDTMLRKVSELGIQKCFGLKLPPYFDHAHFQAMAEIIHPYKIDFLTCVNSLGKGLVIDPLTDRPAIKPKGGFGGVGGSVIKSVALANVRKWSELMSCDIVGCGGVICGRDIYEHILCGAKAVQIGTQLKKEGCSVFDRLLGELKTEMKRHHVTTIEEFRGKLQI